jgi:four helix bundle protein
MREIKGFEDLEVFQESYKLSLELHNMSMSFPKHEQRSLADQVRRASKGVCANIAEGFGKQSISKAEFKRFLLMAMGSADEMRVWLRYSYDLGYIDDANWKRLSVSYRQVAQRLNALHKSWR